MFYPRPAERLFAAFDTSWRAALDQRKSIGLSDETYVNCTADLKAECNYLPAQRIEVVEHIAVWNPNTVSMVPTEPPKNGRPGQISAHRHGLALRVQRSVLRRLTSNSWRRPSGYCRVVPPGHAPPDVWSGYFARFHFGTCDYVHYKQPEQGRLLRVLDELQSCC